MKIIAKGQAFRKMSSALFNFASAFDVDVAWIKVCKEKNKIYGFVDASVGVLMLDCPVSGDIEDASFFVHGKILSYVGASVSNRDVMLDVAETSLTIKHDVKVTVPLAEPWTDYRKDSVLKRIEKVVSDGKNDFKVSVKNFSSGLSMGVKLLDPNKRWWSGSQTMLSYANNVCRCAGLMSAGVYSWEENTTGKLNIIPSELVPLRQLCKELNDTGNVFIKFGSEMDMSIESRDDDSGFGWTFVRAIETTAAAEGIIKYWSANPVISGVVDGSLLSTRIKQLKPCLAFQENVQVSFVPTVMGSGCIVIRPVEGESWSSFARIPMSMYRGDEKCHTCILRVEDMVSGVEIHDAKDIKIGVKCVEREGDLVPVMFSESREEKSVLVSLMMLSGEYSNERIEIPNREFDGLAPINEVEVGGGEIGVSGIGGQDAEGAESVV